MGCGKVKANANAPILPQGSKQEDSKIASDVITIPIPIHIKQKNLFYSLKSCPAVVSSDQAVLCRIAEPIHCLG
jgi:hypothetical protein